MNMMYLNVRVGVNHTVDYEIFIYLHVGHVYCSKPEKNTVSGNFDEFVTDFDRFLTISVFDFYGFRNYYTRNIPGTWFTGQLLAIYRAVNMKKKNARHVASDRYAVYRDCTVRGLFVEITEYVYIPYTINQYTCVRFVDVLYIPTQAVFYSGCFTGSGVIYCLKHSGNSIRLAL